jgi:alpha-mannosidase
MMFDHIKPSATARTLHLVAHFHVDPVWWNTQAASIDQFERSDWSGSPRMGFQRSALDILRQHLDRAEHDADYRFCVAEIDYLEPFWFHHPHERERLLGLLDEQRLDVVGATYNEPNTNLTGLELTRRNLQFGLAFQRDVLGARADISWQLDVFGHDPSLPSVLHDAGVTATVFARGPYGPWGPLLRGGFDSLRPTERRPIASEFEWIAPDGRSVLAIHLAGHYSSGHELDRQASLEDARRFVRNVDETLGPLSASNQVFVPIGTDLGPPVRWITDLSRHADDDVAGALDGPLVVTSTPSMAVDAIRGEVADSGLAFAPQSRDMNPIYTGKDVSYIDSKQAHRATEHLVVEAETWAALAHLSAAAPYPHREIDDAWRLLVYGSHHDALTGTESDQVYVDLTAGWRHAHDLAHHIRSNAVHAIAAMTDTVAEAAGDEPGLAVIVHSTGFGRRRDVVQVLLGPGDLVTLHATGLRVTDRLGVDIPFVVDEHERDADGVLVRASLTFVVEMTGVGRTLVRVCAGPDLPEWQAIAGVCIANAHHRVTVDPAQGGCITSWLDPDGNEIVHEGRVANEIVWYPEYAQHPDHGEGPWHLSPTGSSSGSGDRPALVQSFRSPIGERLRIEGDLHHEGTRRARHTSELTLWAGIDRVDGTVQLDDVDGSDHLVRVRWPIGVRATTPVYETAEAVIGRSPAFVDVDAAQHPWTLDSAANGWFGTSVTCRVQLHRSDPTSDPTSDMASDTSDMASDMASDMTSDMTSDMAIAVAEIVVVDRSAHSLVRPLVVALAATGVTATVTLHDADRFGCLGVDSNVPDIRIVVGVVGDAQVQAQLHRLGEAGHDRVAEQLAVDGSARCWIPPSRPRREILVPGLDVRGEDDLATLVVVGRDQARLEHETSSITEELRESVMGVEVSDPLPSWAADEQPQDRTVAVVNRGTPGSAVDADGTLYMSLQRASTGWPSGVWIDPPRRTTPDGSSFQLQHWTHVFQYALVARRGDWRSAGIARTALEFQRPLHAHVEQCHPGSLDVDEPRLSLGDDGVELRALLVAPPDSESHDAVVDLRVSETHGRSTTRRIDTSLHLGDGRPIDLRGGAVGAAHPVDEAFTIGPFAATTRRLDAVPGELIPAPKLSDDDTPRFSRWWVQGRGPRTSTVGPLAVHLHRPGQGPGSRWSVTVARVPGSLDADDECDALAVELRVDGPTGWFSDGDRTEVCLDPGGFDIVPIDGAIRRNAGHHVVRVTASWVARSGRRGVAYDEHVVSIAMRSPVIQFDATPPDVHLTPGRSVDVEWALSNHASTALHAEIDIVSPWGSWELLPVGRVEILLPPGVSTPILTTVEASLGHRPGTWWWMARVVAGPNVAYSPTATLSVRPHDSDEPSSVLDGVSSSR